MATKATHKTSRAAVARSNSTNGDALAAKHYLASDQEVQTLARGYVDGAGRVAGVRSSYLRVLAAHAKHQLVEDVGGPRRVARATLEAQAEALRVADARLYAIILGAVIGPELELNDALEIGERRKRVLERNRRTNFARTAKATLQRFIENGGNLGTVDPDTATKAQLTVGSVGKATLVDKAKAAATRFERLVKRLMKEDPDFANELVEHVLDTVAPPTRPAPNREPARITRMTPEPAPAH